MEPKGIIITKFLQYIGLVVVITMLAANSPQQACIRDLIAAFSFNPLQVL